MPTKSQVLDMAPKKRTSGGQPQAQKQKKAKAGEIMGAPADSLALAHMSLFESWMNLGQQMNNKSYFLGKNTHGKTLIQFTTRKEHVLDKNLTVDALLTQHLADEAMCSFEFVRIACKLGVSQATAFGFYKFLEEKFPPTSGVSCSQICLRVGGSAQPVFVNSREDEDFVRTTLRSCLVCWPLKPSAFRKYCTITDLQHPGSVQLRPWQLPFRHDLGLRGTGDIAAQRQI